MDEILKRVLRRITPSPAEKKQIKEITDKVLRTALDITKPHGVDVTLAGSFIRDTWMKDKKEFDIFLLFPENVPRQELEKLGLEYGTDIVKRLKGRYKIAYAEHPYVRSNINGFDVDIVPCYKVASAEKIKSAVDRTPFHNQWLLANLKPEQKNDVRLLKQFAKANGIYGSDLIVQGFSGYLCELMIVYYNNFKKWLEAASNWEPGKVIIDPGKHHKNPEDVKKMFPNHPLIVIDPVDPKRNVAAVVSCEKFIRVVSVCKAFLKKPSESFFFKKKLSIKVSTLHKILKARRTELLGLVIKRPDVVPDVLVPQLRRCAKRIVDILQEYEFQVTGWNTMLNDQNAILFFELQVPKLPAVKKVHGPAVLVLDRSSEFLKKYRPLGRIMVEEEHWVAEIPRVFQDAKSKLNDSLSDKTDILMAKGIPSHIAKAISEGFKILDTATILRSIRKDENFRIFLYDYFTKDVLKV
ncbi:MAG: CCA tRNA nucleotidyltransferase [Candidatus Aenigmatarchaeota archaeon]